jgi:hypothetical protein
MSIEDQIRYTQDIRRAALKQGRSVLQPLDKRGNINHAAEPLIFNNRDDALAHQRANRHTLYSLYAGLQTVTK